MAAVEQDREPAYRTQTRPPPWRDVRVLRVVGQVVFLLLVALLLWYLYGNFTTNARRTGLSTTFDFLNRPAGVDIRDSTFRPSQPVRDAIGVGLLNTIRVSIVGIALATVLGILIGVGRLSTNFLVRKSAAVYVETLRNVPVLLWIIFIYTAVVLKLPPVNDAAEFLGLTVFSNRGIVIPWGEGTANVNAFLAALAVAIVVAVAVGAWRTKRFDQTGQPHHRILWGTGVILLLGAAAYVALGAPVEPTVPARDGRLVAGGIQLGPEYAALLMALVIYTASHIAEIVRGSIQAVPKGQTEAAYAIALTGFQRLRFVVLPQAFRIMVPPLANQYLNLTKNSSLALFIGYFDLTRVTQQAIANGNPAPQLILILMGCYLVLSLTISFFANIVNRSLALESR
jgi:general L-amino acid transport system permease protein